MAFTYPFGTLMEASIKSMANHGSFLTVVVERKSVQTITRYTKQTKKFR
jgi:hypothetical protein